MGISFTLQSFFLFLFLQFNSRILYNGRCGWYRLSGISFSRDDKRAVGEQSRAVEFVDRLPFTLT